MHPQSIRITTCLAVAITVALPLLTGARLARAESGKLALTGGVSTIEGAAGGGLTPWAMIGTYASAGQVGSSAFVTGVHTRDYGLVTAGVALGLFDRLELSLAHQDLDTRNNLAPLGLPGLHLRQDILGAKLRVAGEAVLDTDRWMPQVAVGISYKKARPGALAPTLFGPLGAKDSGTDLYLSATKLVLASGTLVNGTLRLTRANQNGLLGFGGAQDGRARLMPEVSVAQLLSPRLAVGAEYRAKPDNLNRSVLGTGALKENDWFDLFLAWAPYKHLSLTLAYVDLGRIAPAVQPRRQTGTYLSAQVAY
jgi:hypothetical protein